MSTTMLTCSPADASFSADGEKLLFNSVNAQGFFFYRPAMVPAPDAV